MSKNRINLQIGLVCLMTVLAIMLFRFSSFYVIPFFILGFLILSRMNKNQAGFPPMEEEDPADWWKKGEEKQNWDI